MPNLTLMDSLPSQDFLDKLCNGKHQILVMDDQMLCLKSNPKFTVSLAAQYARHRHLTIFCINQNFFELPRSFNLNVSHMILTHPGQNYLSITNLSHQLFPGKKSILVKIWKDIEADNPHFPYMVINCGNNVEKNYRILSQIFRSQDMISYIVND